MTVLTNADLTQATLNGTGTFDVMMQAQLAHLEQEYQKNRIRGPEYATVYLGGLQTMMQGAIQFLLERDKAALNADLLAKQIELATVEVQKAQAELVLLQKQDQKVDAEIAQITAQTNLIQQQAANALAEGLNIPKQGLVLDAQKAQIDAQAALATQQTANAVTENSVLVAQECKLRAEYDVLLLTKDKTTAETSLLTQKAATEKAQTSAIGVEAGSVIGKQIALYQAQSDGFLRDAEQKAAKILVDTWNVRRTTDEATVADATNLLNDATIGRAITKLLAGVSA